VMCLTLLRWRAVKKN